MTAFEQSREVKAVLREHVGRHFAGQRKILMLAEDGSLLRDDEEIVIPFTDIESEAA